MASPTDWGSGERVFGPPDGTLDVDWLVPALLERVATATPAAARHALATAWSAYREGRLAAAPTPATGPPGGRARERGDRLADAARELVRDAAREYGVPPGSSDSPG